MLESRFPPSAPSRALDYMPWTGPLGRMPDGMRRGVAPPVHRRRSVVVQEQAGGDAPFRLRRVDSLPSLGVMDTP
eukprot:840615-Pelagomonas_calceolata.AAC.1